MARHAPPLLLLSLLSLGACTQQDPIATDLFIDNRSGAEVTVIWDRGQGLETLGPIADGARVQFDSASLDGEAPTVAEALSYLELTDGSLPVHRQSPIVDELWLLTLAGDRVEAALRVDASTLNLDTALPEDACCCTFTTDDIVEEDLLTREQCEDDVAGECIVVQSPRLTPHPCCPDASGDRCYPVP